MKNFFKYTLATLTGITISFFLFLIFIIIILASSGGESVQVQEKSILHLILDREIVDRASKNPLEGFDIQKFQPEPYLGLNEIIENIEKAKKDDNIKGIYLDAPILNAGLATINEIRNALIDFKASGKFIISYSDSYTQRAYYLSSVANKIYLTPTGVLEFSGLRAEILYFKKMLDKLGVEAQVIKGKDNKFKSAVEPLLLEKMSDENREQIKVYLTNLWDYMLEGISNARNISKEELNVMADEMLPIRNPESAVQKKMIDGIKYKDEVFTELKELSGIGDNNLRFVTFQEYKNVPTKDLVTGKDKIAVIYASGAINTGEGDNESIGSETLSEAIRSARIDSTVKAIVLRVNSGGGSILASEIIWREVDLARQAKPVIASMGDVAASGGYYISSPANVIVANPNTITGSIGIFGVILNGKEFLTNKLGITSDGVSTNENSGFISPFRPLSVKEKEIMQEYVDRGYNTFTSHVATARNMTVEKVDGIGQGRVWSGKDAKEIGLVDEYGGLKKAIEIAAEKSGLENYRIITLPKQLGLIEQLIMDLSASTKASILKNELKENYKIYKQVKNLKDIEGVQVRMPYEIELY